MPDNRLKANQSCVDLKSKVARRKIDAEPCNLEEEDPHELISEYSKDQSLPNLDKTGNFNDLMNKIINQYD